MAKHPQITKDLLKKYFGPAARINGGWGFGFTVKMASGASVEIAADGEMKNFRGSEIYPPAMQLMRDLFGSCTVSGNAQHVMLAALHGQPLGVEVNTEHKRSWFKPDPPPVPRVTGAHGSANIATPDMLRAAGLTGGEPGKGLLAIGFKVSRQRDQVFRRVKRLVLPCQRKASVEAITAAVPVVDNHAQFIEDAAPARQMKHGPGIRHHRGGSDPPRQARLHGLSFPYRLFFFVGYIAQTFDEGLPVIIAAAPFDKAHSDYRAASSAAMPSLTHRLNRTRAPGLSKPVTLK